MIKELVQKLNNWLRELYQEKIFIEGDFILMEVHGKSQIVLIKQTENRGILQYVFSDLRGIKNFQVAEGDQNKFVLIEKEEGAFERLNSQFEKFSSLLKQKAVQGSGRHLFIREIEHFSFPNIPKTTPHIATLSEAIIKAEKQDELILDNIDFTMILPLELEDLQSKIKTKKLSNLSLRFCMLSKMQTSLFQKLMNIIKITDSKKIDLSNNDLHELSATNLELLFQTLIDNFNIKELHLAHNSLGNLIKKNTNLFINFLKNNCIERINFQSNDIDDAVVSLLSKYGQAQALHMGSNKISNLGALSFYNNPYIREINFFNNPVAVAYKNQIDLITQRNSKIAKSIPEYKFTEQAIAIMQGHKKQGSLFNKLPSDLILFILAILGEHLEKERINTNMPPTINTVCKLIMLNVLSSKSGNLVWNQEIGEEKAKRKIFKTRDNPHLFLAQLNYYEKCTNRLQPDMSSCSTLK